MIKARNIFHSLVIAGCLLSSISAFAGVQISATRIIYPSSSDEVMLSVKNTGDISQLVQAWVDNIDNKGKAPFIVTPPLFKLTGGSTNILHFMYVDQQKLPADRESIFWANVKSVEAKQKNAESESQLQLASRTRIKLIWRPSTLNKMDANQAYKKLTFSTKAGKLTVRNPSPYYVTFQKFSVDGVAVRSPDKTIAALSLMLAPFSEKTYSLPNSTAKQVRWNSVDDYGNGTEEVVITL